MSKSNIKIKCVICEQEFVSRGFGSHIQRKHNIQSVQQYYDKYIKQDNEGICCVCKKPTSFINIKRGYRLHCSAKCNQQDENVRQKQANTNIYKYGHPCSFASTHAKEQIKLTKKKRYGSETYNNPEKMKNTKINRYGEYFINKEKSQATCQQRYGVDHTFQVREFRLKSLHKMRQNGNRSSYEDMLETFFINNNIKYEQEYNLDSRYPYHCDFYLLDHDLFIELNIYWTHGRHFYDPSNECDQKTLKMWINKLKQGLKQYQSAIDIWTKLDIEKRNCAIQNKLNYIVLWNKKDIEEFIASYKI